MSDLVAIAYPDRDTAETVRQTLTDLMTERAIELEDAVVVTRDEDGKVKLHQAHRRGHRRPVHEEARPEPDARRRGADPARTQHDA
jgi:hypothetical protein